MLATFPNAYLYKQYDDDDDVRAMFDAYNQLVQSYLDFLNDVNLPNYTGDGSLVSGDLLDWVCNGLYGFPRPVLPFGVQRIVGELNTYTPNYIILNGQKIIPPDEVFTTSDDVFRRCLTWLFYKGDGKQFTIRWLKRRIQRFLTLANGEGQGIADTYRISVTFGANNEVNINLRTSLVTFGVGALNTYVANGRALNSGDFTVTPLGTFDLAPVFKAAVAAGVLELPFQYTWIVNI